jgi:chorismate mutase/prephenate dehydratase
MANSGQSRPASENADDSKALAELRRRIDVIDSEILEKLNDRARVVVEVGALKHETGAPVYSATREKGIVDRLTGENSGPFPAAGIAPVFREIVSATRSLEDNLSIAYFGPEGTFTHLAAKQRFGEVANLRSESSIPNVFGAVESGKAELGVIPIENTTAGVVTATFDTFADSDVSICGEIVLPISLDLFSHSGELADVRRVASHPQPLAQSRQWLDEHLSGVERLETASTAAAVSLAVSDESVAAIGSSIAGGLQGLSAIETAIEDRVENTTRFVLIGRQFPEATGDDMTTVLFTIRKDESGGLHRLIEPMAQRGVNLTSIQLRPIAGKPWEYYFFIDIEGHRDEPQVAAALVAAAEVAHTCRVLGSFPRAAGARAKRSGEGL